tara:strand:+ start:9 stop:872 length:864 start_codon:yes stop_codon:yes gene_type:complete
MYVGKHCSPKNKNNGSCISKELLKKIAKILNRHLKSNIKIKDSTYRLQKNIHRIIKKEKKCTVEACWLTYDLLKDKLSNEEYRTFINSFRPLIPDKWYKEPNKWLNTDDINKVLKQYENNYKHFKYTGASPIDFELKNNNGTCLVNELCNIDLKSILNKKKTCIGMVFNTDPHNKPGQHWFSMYVDLIGKNRGTPTIYHYDSIADKPSKNIIDLVTNLKNQGKELDISFDFIFNDIRHQFKNTECGVYSIHFIISMLKGIDFIKYVNNDINDKEMEKFRKEFFISLK